MIADIDINTLSTPCYCYDIGLLKETLAAIDRYSRVDRRFRVHYALKANFRPQILEIISNAGLGADCVSGWEIKSALQAGFSPDKIVYAGVGKTDEEISFALQCGIACFNVESLQELNVINELALQKDVIANVAIRVNPEIDAHTHQYITTGLSDNKFGIPLQQLDEAIALALELPALNLKGLHFHIGSQITQFECYKLLCDRINDIYTHYQSNGIIFNSINVGGGLGIDYDNPDANPIPDFESYFKLFADNLKLSQDTLVHFELGRSIVAQCGTLIAKVLFIKDNPTRRFAVIDAGMTDLIRPALYQAHHKIEPLKICNPDGELLKYDVVGPICESSDVFGKDELLPRLSRSDILAIRSAGAYGEAMASNYNMRPLPSYYFYNI